MKVLVIGGGGREHTLVWKLAQSPRITDLFAHPVNGGISSLAKPIPLPDNASIKELADYVETERIDLTVVGPGSLLCKGIANVFFNRGLRIFAPSREGAQLEGSKVWAKNFLKKYNIPSADYQTFTDYDEALDYVMQHDYPVVVKASGLAAGKGVTVAHTPKEAKEALKDAMVDRVFGEAGNEVVIEDFLTGQEASVLAFTDGENVLSMLPAQDHKPLLDGDKGPNTGGMGAICPTPLVTKEMRRDIEDKVLQPVVRGMIAEGIKYVGILYAGMMVNEKGFQVLEFNCRFGDPEAQVLLPLMETDLLDLIEACIDGTLDQVQLKWKKDTTCLGVVMASGGYPGKYEKGIKIEGLESFDPNSKELIVFHAGTQANGEDIRTSGGRVLAVTAIGNSPQEAREAAYAGVEKIKFEGAQYRKDIGSKALLNK